MMFNDYMRLTKKALLLLRLTEKYSFTSVNEYFKGKCNVKYTF